MHELRDEMATLSADGRAAIELKSFGSVRQPLGDNALGLASDLPADWASYVKPELDVQVYPQLLTMVAKATMGAFKSQLDQVCRSFCLELLPMSETAFLHKSK